MTDTGRTVFGGTTPAVFTTPDFTRGWGPGFGGEANLAEPSDILDFTDAYQLDASPAGTSTNQAVDDDWFSWDPAGARPDRLTIKRAGFYWVWMTATPDAATPADPWYLEFSAGNASSRTWMPGGVTAVQPQDGTVVPLHADQVVALGFHPVGNTGMLVTYGALILLPLFAA